MIINLLNKLLLSITSTAIFDYMRDLKCSTTCCHSVTLKEKPNYILDKNWKIIFLSYNYALFYGMLFSLIFKMFLNPLYHITLYFIFISFVQRLMCAFVMNGIHRNTSPYVHAGYYLLYFIGSMLQLDNIIITCVVMSFVSIVSSILLIHVKGKQYDYSWRKQYCNGKLINVSLEDRNKGHYEQPYSKFEYYHLRIIFGLHMLYCLSTYF